MASSLMIPEQQYLPEGSARLLVPEGADRELRVTAGRLWLTSAGRAPSGDVWLGAGDCHLLRAGEEAVIEGWPSASFALQPRGAAQGHRLSGWLRAWRVRGGAAAPAMPSGCCAC